MNGDVFLRKFYEKPSSFREIVVGSHHNYGNKVFMRSINKDDSLKEITFSQFYEDNINFGTGLFSLGLKEKRFAVISETRYEWLEAYLAAIMGGGIIVPLDKELNIEQIKSFIEFAEVDCIVFSSQYRNSIFSIAEQLTNVKFFIDMDDEEFDDLSTGRFITYKKICSIGKQELEIGNNSYLYYENDHDALAAIIFTSGTTGSSKGVMLSENNVLASIHAASNMVDFSYKDELVSVLPLHHTYETCCGILTPLFMGITINVNNSLKYVMKNFKRFKPTGLVLVPLFATTMFKRINDELKKKNKEKLVNNIKKISNVTRKVKIDLRRVFFKEILEAFGGRLEKMIVGGAPLDPELVDYFDELGVSLAQGYGTTECAPLVAVNPYYAIKKNSVGIPALGSEVRIADYADDGSTIYKNSGEIGEILVKGPNVMLGYYNQPEATAESFNEDGFFKTGDIGYMDDENYIYITGRKKNVIVLNNGKNVFPEEIEEYLQKLDFVLECVVLGNEGKDGEIVLTAYIFPDYNMFIGKTEDEISSYIKSEVMKLNKSLPSFKQIRSIEIKKTEFEKTTTKKIIRYKVTEKE